MERIFNNFKFYSIFVVLCLLSCVFFISPVRAEVHGPGWFSVTGEPISPQKASLYYKQKAIAPLRIFASEASTATTVTPEITELARALQYDPKLIYEYVHNHIDYAPYFGSLKGATLTYLDASGNDFDQASLMIALLRVSGYTANYEYGAMTISKDQLDNWVGVGRSTALDDNIFGCGGIPIQIYSDFEAAVVDRVWVKVNIEGADYLFDPALKAYTDIPKINIGQALNYNRDDFLAAVSNGATVSSDCVCNVNEAALSDKLVEYSSNLTSTIRSQYPNSTVEKIVGGRSIIATTLSEYQTSLPLPTVPEAAWDEIPSEYTAVLRVEHVGIDYTFTVPEIAGKRLTVTYADGDYHPELRLDGELIAGGTTTTQGSKYDLILTIDHPYAGSNGAYCDQTSIYDMKSGATYALVSAFAGISEALLNKRQKQLDIYQAEGLPETSEAVLGESLHIMGLTWLKETLMTSGLMSDFVDFARITHHCMGRMSQESSYFIDVKTWLESCVPKFDDDVSIESARIAYCAFSSALEHGILEQMMGSETPAVSTVKLLQIANNDGDKIFYADSVNFTSVRAQLRNYNTSWLDRWQSDLDSGIRDYIILPENGEIIVNQWRGVGYVSSHYEQQGIEWAIYGGLYGGYGSEPGTIDPLIIESNTFWNVEAESIVEVQPEFSHDPVNMANGAFVHSNTDLSLGRKTPLGLTFSRSYKSSLNQKQKSFAYGWTHNYDIYLNRISHSAPGLGCRQPVDAASLITALYISYDVFAHQNDALGWMTIILSGKWAVDQLLNNAINVHLGSRVMEYVKLADGTYAPPPGVTTQLLNNGNGTFSLEERFGRRLDFNANDRISALTDIDGNTMTFTYSGDNLTMVSDTFGRSLNFTYNEGRISSVSDSTGRSVSYSYDTNGDLTGYIDLEGKTWNYGYDTEHRMISITNPLSITTVTNAYDSLGRVVSQSVPRQGGTTTTYDFYFPGFRNIEKDSNDNETIYFYDKKGNSIGRENALGQRSTKKYDGQNHVIERTDPRANKMTYAYDGNQNLTGATNALNKTTDYTYDSQFRLTDITDPLGHHTYMDYNSEHHLILTRDAEGNQFTATHYPNGLKETSADGRGTTTTLTYDTNGHPQTSRVGSHPEITYVYDAIGRMTGLTDQAGSTTSFEYDKRGLITKSIDPLGRNSTFTYDDAGRLSSATDRNSETITYTYTPSGKLESITYSDSSTVNLSYDELDNLVQMQDSLGTTSYTYDAANRLTSVTDPNDFTVSYGYDEAGNLAALTYPGGKTVSYTYDALNRLKTVTNWLGQSVSYSYDEAGRLITLVNFNGSITTYDYDDANRLIYLENRRSDASLISTYHFELDENGNRTKVVEDEPLAPAIATEAIDYSYNTERNRLESTGTLDFSWDNEGQLSGMDGTNFTFDTMHRLVGITGTATLQYAYDGANRRLEAVRNGVTTRYVYGAGGNLLAEANTSNEITRYYIHGLGLLAMLTPTDETYCYHYNAIGTTIAMSDASQTLVNKYAYTPFGEVSNQTETVPQPFKFVGRYGVMTEPNGFYYMRARYYDPAVGRFISEDPIGFAGGDVNLYAYVTNNPINLIDPWGLCGEKSSWWKDVEDWLVPSVYAEPGILETHADGIALLKELVRFQKHHNQRVERNREKIGEFTRDRYGNYQDMRDGVPPCTPWTGNPAIDKFIDIFNILTSGCEKAYDAIRD